MSIDKNEMKFDLHKELEQLGFVKSQMDSYEWYHKNIVFRFGLYYKGVYYWSFIHMSELWEVSNISPKVLLKKLKKYMEYLKNDEKNIKRV